MIKQLLKLSLFVLLAISAGCILDDDNNNGLTTVVPKYTCDSVAEASDLTRIDTSMTPRADANAEWLALEVSGGFMAPEGLYQRIAAELTSIRATFPSIAHIDMSTCYRAIHLFMDDASFDAVLMGNYTAWDELNQNLRAQTEYVEDLGNVVSFEFEGRYNLNRVAEAYAGLPGTESVISFGGITVNGDVFGAPEDICLAPRDTVHYYIFETIIVDATPTSHRYIHTGFRVDSSGNIRYLGEYDSFLQSSGPDWYNALQDCGVFLRGYVVP